MNGGLPQLPNFSKQHINVHRVGPLQVKSATADDVLNAKAFNALPVVGVAFAPTTVPVIGQTGRNLIVTVTDANNSETWQFEVFGTNQFGEQISELFPSSGPQVGAAAKTGSKIFATVTSIVPRVLAGDLAAGDNVKIGTGDKVGLMFMFSSNLREILDAELQVALQATAATKKTVNAANFDSTYMAINAAFFAGSAVVAGDMASMRVRTDCLTPDDVSRQARTSP